MCRADRPHCCRPIGRTFFFFFLVFHVNPLFFSNLFPLITLLAACGNEGPPRGSLYRPPFFLFRTTTTIIFGRVDSPALASLLQQATLLPIFFFSTIHLKDVFFSLKNIILPFRLTCIIGPESNGFHHSPFWWNIISAQMIFSGGEKNWLVFCM